MKKKKGHSPLWYYVVGGIMGYSKIRGHNVKFRISDEVKNLKPPFVGIANHQGYYDWAYAARAFFPMRFRFVVSRYQFLNPKTGKLREKLNSIPKSQFTSDASAVKEIIRTIKRGENVFIFPSGRLSLFGEDDKPVEGTYELLKKLGVPVVMVHLDGSYRTAPRYNTEVKKGRGVVTAYALFTPEELKNLPEEEAKKRLYSAFCHDDFNSENVCEFKSPDIAKGLDDLLYMCPDCKANYTVKVMPGQKLMCKDCGFSVQMDNYFKFTALSGNASPKTITEWSHIIKAEEKKRILSDPDFTLREKMDVLEHIKEDEQLTKTGECEISLSRDGIKIEGTKKDGRFSRHYTLKEYPAMHIFDKIFLLVPDNEAVICVSPANAKIATRWAVVSETLSSLLL